MPARHHFLKLLSAIAVLAMFSSTLQPAPASAQGGDSIKRQVNAESGRVSFLGPESGRSLAASKALGTSIRPQDPALALAQRFAPEFGIANPGRDLSEMKNIRGEDGRITARYQQNHDGIPVMGAELIVNTNDAGDLYSMNGEVSPGLSLRTQPVIDSAGARETALQAVARLYAKSVGDFAVSEPELWIYDASLLQRSTRPVELVWRMEVTAREAVMPVRELVLVNAQRGGLSLHFNQIDTAWTGDGSHAGAAGTPVIPSRASGLVQPPLVAAAQIKTYNANNGVVLPGTFVCDQANAACTAGDAHAKAAHKYAIGTNNLYLNSHARYGINGSNMPIISTVHFDLNYANAFWNGGQMVYGDEYGFALADDVVAHELTHGVTQYESNLFYFYQSGAINESFSDVWGEYYDQTNALGTDTALVKWKLGEDVTGVGALRDMKDPTFYLDPDMMSSPYYYEESGDNGGVHYNSGVNNKAVYLMVDGDTFNNRTVTPLGWTKTGAIYYEAQTRLLTSGADYSDLYYALQRACSTLVGQKGITVADCAEVTDAVEAVEMNGQPSPGFNEDAALCPPGGTLPYGVFADDLENGTGNWSFTNGAQPRWQYDSDFGSYAHSGNHSLYANDYPAEITDAWSTLKPLLIPNNAYLHFAHAFNFDYPNYDGGVLEYSTNGGASWIDSGPLMDVNDYNGTIYSNWVNPLGGRSAFVGSSHGYISTRLNLGSLVGQTVQFRWRMALDDMIFDMGWWVDDVQVYRCGHPNMDVTVGGALMNTYYVPVAGSVREVYAGVNQGPVVIENFLGVPSVASQRVIYGGGSYSEMMGLPLEQLTKEYLFPYYNNVAMDSQLRVSNVGGAETTITVYLGMQQIDQYTLAAGGATRKNYTGRNGGPLRVTSSASDILTTIRVLYGGSSYSELMGFPANLLAKEYLFPYYNNVAMDSQLRVSNVGGADTTIKVYLSSDPNPIDSYTLAAGGATRKNYTGKNSGPLRVASSDSNILTTIRVLYGGNSLSELMGFPTGQLGQEYWYPVYDNSALDSQLRVSNIGSATTHITVYAGTEQIDSYDLGKGGAVRKNYPKNTGPLHVVSSTQPILTTIRMLYAGTSYYEMTGLPDNQLSTQYFFPWYNNTAMSSELRFAEP